MRNGGKEERREKTLEELWRVGFSFFLDSARARVCVYVCLERVDYARRNSLEIHLFTRFLRGFLKLADVESALKHTGEEEKGVGLAGECVYVGGRS